MFEMMKKCSRQLSVAKCCQNYGKTRKSQERLQVKVVELEKPE